VPSRDPDPLILSTFHSVLIYCTRMHKGLLLHTPSLRLTEIKDGFNIVRVFINDVCRTPIRCYPKPRYRDALYTSLLVY
jgi:hypothetical protein